MRGVDSREIKGIIESRQLSKGTQNQIDADSRNTSSPNNKPADSPDPI